MVNFIPSKQSRISLYAPNRIRDEATIVSVVRQGHEWRVRYEGTFWTARLLNSGASLMPGDIVYVADRKGLVLLVELPEDQSAA